MVFTSAAFLAGLALLTVPWWLHRLNAHPKEQQPFASLFLMRPSTSPVNVRKQLQHLLLLSLRWLLLIASCLAFAEPALRLAGERLAGSAAVPHQVLVIDRSLSMDARVNGTSAFELALTEARRQLDNLGSGQRAALLTADAELSLVVPLTDDVTRLTGALATLKPAHSHLNAAGLLGRIATFAETLTAPGEPLEAVLISDFQASGMPDQFNALIDGATLATQLIQVQVGQSGTPPPNRAVTDLSLTGEAELTVTVQSFQASGAEVSVRLEEDGIPVGRESLALAANGTAAAVFALPRNDAAKQRRSRGHSWTATLETEDVLGGDNVRRLVSQATDAVTLPVLTTDERAWAYLRAGIQAGAPRFEPTLLEALPSGDAALVIVLGSGALTSEQERRLQRYLANGGKVFMTVDGQTRSRGSLPLLDAPLAADRFQQTARGATAIDRSHPALAGYASWPSLTFFQALSSDAGTGGEVILALDDGTPLLTEHRIGAGRLLLLGTALDPAWSTLVVRPAFVDLLANVLGYLAEDILPTSAIAGEPFAIPAQSVQLFSDAGERVLGLVDTVGRPTISLAEPGIYQLRTPARSRRLAVNAPLSESRLDPVAAELLSEWQRSAAAGAREAEDLQARAPVSAAETNETERLLPLAPWLLLLLAILVFLEPLYANLFPGRARETRGAGAEAS
ncbi:MAG: BatA domain-containing protein [Pseudomonadota bacterium]